MGKSKKRILAKAKNEKDQFLLTREEALKSVCEIIKTNPTDITAKNLISLFGLSAEELAEEGVNYEVLRSLDGIF